MKQNSTTNYSNGLFVGLSSEIAYCKWDSISSSVQYEELSKSNKLIYVKVSSLKEASDTVRDYIKEHNLSSSNWTGGLVIDDNHNFVAQVSYNGRIWDNPDYFKAKEVL